MSEIDYNEAPFLLTREQARRRYNVCIRTLQEMYRRDPEFPVVRVGRKVLVHRDQADAYFTRYIGDEIARDVWE